MGLHKPRTTYFGAFWWRSGYVCYYNSPIQQVKHCMEVRRSIWIHRIGFSLVGLIPLPLIKLYDASFSRAAPKMRQCEWITAVFCLLAVDKYMKCKSGRGYGHEMECPCSKKAIDGVCMRRQGGNRFGTSCAYYRYIDSLIHTDI